MWCLFLASPFLIRFTTSDKVFTFENFSDEQEVAIVFGAGLKEDGTPSDALKDRLIIAGDMYWAGQISKILVSGDNRYENYNEPDAMKEYLVNNYDIPAEDISQDYAGRSTYETCARASNIWGIDEAILITQEFHLPRAIFTCESMHIDSVGVSATLQPYIFDDYYKIRELFATYKAVLDVFILRPNYIKGDSESL